MLFDLKKYDQMLCALFPVQDTDKTVAWHIIANPPHFTQETPVLYCVSRFPPGVTIPVYFSLFVTIFHTLSPLVYQNLFLALCSVQAAVL